jgi:hypothetical protein
MARVLLDTTILVDILRGRQLTRARLEGLQSGGDLPYVCAISIEEIMSGLRPREFDAAGALFDALAIAPLAPAEGKLAGAWRQIHRRRGRTLSQADCLIAAAAVGIGGRLATGNPKDFPMTGLEVEHWPAGH